MKLATIMEYEDLVKLQSGVVVEGWKHIGYGRGRRMFETEFTAAEREECRELYRLFLKWYSGWHGTGVPKQHAMSLQRYQLAIRLCNFFGVKL